MIIECINCNKKFLVNSDLIPTEGRSIQCGSCNHIWFFKPEKKPKKNTEKPIIINQDIDPNKNDAFENKKKEIQNEQNKKNYKSKNYQLTKYKKKEQFSFSKFLSYIIVLIISFIALVIFIDTFKKPLYSNFPILELIIFNLFETLIDIKLFIKDLF